MSSNSFEISQFQKDLYSSIISETGMTSVSSTSARPVNGQCSFASGTDMDDQNGVGNSQNPAERAARTSEVRQNERPRADRKHAASSVRSIAHPGIMGCSDWLRKYPVAPR